MMSRALRKWMLFSHVATSVGLTGAIAVFLVLVLSAITGEGEYAIRASYFAMQLSAVYVIVPLAFLSILTGLIMSLGTNWGLFKYYWVVAKLLLIVFATAVLLAKIGLINKAALLSSDPVFHRAELHELGIQLAVHAGGGLLFLLLPLILSIFKPEGRTKYGLRQKAS